MRMNRYACNLCREELPVDDTYTPKGFTFYFRHGSSYALKDIKDEGINSCDVHICDECYIRLKRFFERLILDRERKG